MLKKFLTSSWTFYLLLFAGANWSFVCAQSPVERRVTAQAENISGDRLNFSAVTANGAKVYSYRQLNQATLRAIDKGLSDLFAVARKNGYGARLNYADYTIYVARPDRQRNDEGTYSPGIAIPTKQYAGSIYDQGGYIYVAGLIISNSPGAFLIVDYNQQNLNGISDIVRYEGEHLVLFYNDRRRYNQTADHSQGGGHPILR